MALKTNTTEGPRAGTRESRDGDVEGRAKSGAEREGRDRDVEGRAKSGAEREGRDRDRGSRSGLR